MRTETINAAEKEELDGIDRLAIKMLREAVRHFMTESAHEIRVRILNLFHQQRVQII